MKYGIAIFKGDAVIIQKFTKATDINSFALIFLKKKMREEGFKFNEQGRKDYMQSWIEWHNDMCGETGNEPITESFQIVDTAADTLVYSNVHLQKFEGGEWVPLTSEEKSEFCKVIREKLEGVE